MNFQRKRPEERQKKPEESSSPGGEVCITQGVRKSKFPLSVHQLNIAQIAGRSHIIDSQAIKKPLDSKGKQG